jgi:uncharacterized protein DUF3300
MRAPGLARSLAFALSLALPVNVAFAQDVAYQYQTAPAMYAPSRAELDRLLAPVALYPDALLGNILAASTYPLEVIALARWLERNAALSGIGLEQAVAQQPWDASVKSLAPFRNVVSMMNGELDWMQRVGNAFLADEAGVMDAVQGLRRKARDNGTLQANEHERVVEDSTVIMIEPAQREAVYVPYYDPAVVYGPWWWPGYPPYAWGSYYFGPWDYFWSGIAFGGVWVSGGWHDHHQHPDWHGHHLVDHGHHQGGQSHAWTHDPSHRIGVPYADGRSRQRYRPANPSYVQGRQAFRGFDMQPGVRGPVQPYGLRPSPSTIARQQSSRGHGSLAARPGGGSIARAPSYGGGSAGHARSSGGGSTSRNSGGGGRR